MTMVTRCYVMTIIAFQCLELFISPLLCNIHEANDNIHSHSNAESIIINWGSNHWKTRAAISVSGLNNEFHHTNNNWPILDDCMLILCWHHCWRFTRKAPFCRNYNLDCFHSIPEVWGKTINASRSMSTTTMSHNKTQKYVCFSSNWRPKGYHSQFPRYSKTRSTFMLKHPCIPDLQKDRLIPMPSCFLDLNILYWHLRFVGIRLFKS